MNIKIILNADQLILSKLGIIKEIYKISINLLNF
jgi:hypothetical protein